MATQYNQSPMSARQFSDTAPQFALAANTELTYTVPGTFANLYWCEFSWPYNANVWVGVNVTATVPSAGTMSGSTRVELRPDVRLVRGGDVLHFISDAIVANAGFSLLSLPS